MNNPKHEEIPKESSNLILSTDAQSLLDLVPPVSGRDVERLKRELSTLTLDAFLEGITHARRILTTHRLTSDFSKLSAKSGEHRELAPPPAEQVGGLVTLRPFPERKLIVLGDIHGDAESLLSILAHSRVLGRIANGEDLYLLALGDYINKGPHSLEALYVLSRLMSDPVNQGRIILLRGNHEDRHGGGKAKEETRLRKKFYTSIQEHQLSKSSEPGSVHRAVEECAQYFDELPHTLYSPCGLLASHSGYSQWILDHNKKKVWEALREWPPHQQIMKELLDSSIAPKTSSKDVKKIERPSPVDTYHLMEKLRVTLLLRGHQSAAPKALDPRETWKSGYWYLSHTQPGISRSIVTLNSSRFCGSALPAYAEVLLTNEPIGLQDCTLYSLHQG